MKRKILLETLLVAALTAGSLGAWAADEIRPMPAPPAEMGQGPCGKAPHEGHLARMAEVLGLSDAQQKQIRDIEKSEHEKSGPFMKKIGEYRKQLRDAAEKTPFDEASVRSIAARQAQAEVELSVSHARMQSRINSVLTPEQRKLQQKLRPPMEPGPGHPPFFHGEQQP
ncbi:MAG: Spy/CpxP family protein refolding chaperone [Geobacteraceae bacterium]|nr:Spy/CpxP family protein refolding chaperone [Geobacteraceae bacterium]